MNVLDWKFLRFLWVLKKHISLRIFFLLLDFFCSPGCGLMLLLDSIIFPFCWAHPYPEADLTYENVSYIEEDIPKLTPFPPPAPKSFPILWARTWQGYICKANSILYVPTCFFILGKCVLQPSKRWNSSCILCSVSLSEWSGTSITKLSSHGFPLSPDVAHQSFQDHVQDS